MSQRSRAGRLNWVTLEPCANGPIGWLTPNSSAFQGVGRCKRWVKTTKDRGETLGGWHDAWVWVSSSSFTPETLSQRAGYTYLAAIFAGCRLSRSEAAH